MRWHKTKVFVMRPVLKSMGPVIVGVKPLSVTAIVPLLMVGVLPTVALGDK